MSRRSLSVCIYNPLKCTRFVFFTASIKIHLCYAQHLQYRTTEPLAGTAEAESRQSDAAAKTKRSGVSLAAFPAAPNRGGVSAVRSIGRLRQRHRRSCDPRRWKSRPDLFSCLLKVITAASVTSSLACSLSLFFSQSFPASFHSTGCHHSPPRQKKQKKHTNS